MELKPSVQQHAEMLRELSQEASFTVFLCGPTLDNDNPEAAALLRQKLIEVLEADGFEVVLGEDDGLENERLNIGLNAQDNELEFIGNQCNAVVIVADSVGSFCELGLFTWHFVHEHGVIDRSVMPAFIVLIKEQHSPDSILPKTSYFNEGPIGSLQGFGMPLYVNFEEFDANHVRKILRNCQRRSKITPVAGVKVHHLP